MLKKVFAATLAGLFITAPAFANIENYGADKEAYENSGDFRGMKMGGSFFIKGNYSAAGHEASAYESDFEVKADFVVDEKTSATFVIEAFDEVWDKNATSGQNQFEVTKATMNHTFEAGTTFYGGIAGNADQWGSDFNDDQGRTYFVQLEQALPFGTLTLKNEKLNEGAADQDGDDKDGYLVGVTTEAAGFTVKPAFYMLKDRSEAKDVTSYKFILPVTGKIGAINLDSEFVFAKDERYEATEITDGTTFGAWVDASTTVSNLSLNASLFYSGTDDDFALSDEGGNLCPMEILGDEYKLSGATLVRVKASKSLTDKVSVDASLAYMYTNFDDKYKVADVTPGASDAKGVNDYDTFNLDSAYEVDANVTYKASDAVTLSCGVAYLDGDVAYGPATDVKTKALDHARTDAYVKILVAF